MFPNEEANIPHLQDKINRMDLAAPVFSPDSQKIAYFGIFYDENGGELKKQVRILSTEDGREEVIMNSIEQQDQQEPYSPFAVYPVRWYKDAQGEKILLEKRELDVTGLPFLTTGFLIYDVSKKILTPITLFTGKGQPIQDCIGDEFPSGRLSAACHFTARHKGRSHDGRYMLLWRDEDDQQKYFIIDSSVLENGESLEAEPSDFQSCGGMPVWPNKAGELICSGLDLDKSSMVNSSAVMELEKTDTFTIPYAYKLYDLTAHTTSVIYQENVSYGVDFETRKKILEKIPVVKVGLDKESSQSGSQPSSQEQAQALDYYLGFSFNTIFIGLKSKIKPVIGSIHSSRFITRQSSYDKDDVHRDKPIEQRLFLTDLQGNEKQIAHYSITNITDQQEVFKKLEELKINSDFIATMRGNKANIQSYTIERNVEVKFLGEVIK